MEIKWIKLDTGIFDNRKIKQIRTLPDGDSLVIIWLQLMCLAGTVNDDGKIYFTEEIPYTDQMLATAFGEPLATVQMALKVFAQFKMINVIDDIIYISNWGKYQAVSGMEKVREQTRKRVAEYREKQKAIGSVTGNVTVTQSNATDIDKDIDKENTNTSVLVEKKSPTKRFQKPSVADIEAYLTESGYSIDADKFWNYYESKGWLVGRAPMKDWKAAVRNWAKGSSWGNRKPDFKKSEIQEMTSDDREALQRRMFEEGRYS